MVDEPHSELKDRQPNCSPGNPAETQPLYNGHASWGANAIAEGPAPRPHSSRRRRGDAGDAEALDGGRAAEAHYVDGRRAGGAAGCRCVAARPRRDKSPFRRSTAASFARASTSTVISRSRHSPGMSRGSMKSA